MSNSLTKNLYNFLGVGNSSLLVDLFNKATGTQDYNKILNNLYLGNYKSSLDDEFLKENNIKYVINCTPNLPFHNSILDNNRYRLSMLDIPDSENIKLMNNKIDDVVNFIEKNINNGGILVHCNWGFMRSATILVAYLIKKFRINKDDAINYIRDIRPYALNKFFNFNEVLDKYQKKLKII